MKPASASPLLAHELLFGAFLLVTWCRLALALGPVSSEALLYAALLAVNATFIWRCHQRPTTLHWHLRLWFYPVAMNIIFPHMKGAIPKISPVQMDALLQQVDGWLVGPNLSLRCESLTNPVLTEMLSGCYLLFFPYLLFSLVYYGLGKLDLFKRFMIGLFTIYGLGFLGYTWVPASGPYVAMSDQFAVPLRGWWLTAWNTRIVGLGSNGVDVFPSLHCAVSCYFLLFDRQHRRWRFWLYLLPCVGLWLSTIYLRYHYFIDLVCGFALAAFALWLANRRDDGKPSAAPATQRQTPPAATRPNGLPSNT